MKKILALIFALIILLCGCQQNNQVDTSSMLSDNNSANMNDEIKVTKYQGRETYENISLGYTGSMAQDDEYYYYSDENGFFSVNKKNGDRKTISADVLMSMFTFNDEIYFHENGAVLVFNKKSQSLVRKSYAELFSLKLKVPQTRYGLNVLMVKDGWLVYINDNETGVREVYLTDKDFTTKKLLPIYSFDFVLDDDVFFLLDDGNVSCYNIETEKGYYITTDFSIDSSEEQTLSTYSFEYLGNGRILAYGNGKLNVINLVDGKIIMELPYSPDDISEIVFDDKKTYVNVKESQEKYRIDTIAHSDNKIETIYNFEVNLPHYYIVIENIDNNYLYLGKMGHYNDDGTPSGEYIRINKDGSGEKLLFKQIATN